MMDADFKKFVFNAGATLYDLFTSQRTWWEHCRKLSPGTESFDRILDVGCGPGISSFVLEEQHPHTRVLGLDVAKKMLDRARREKRRRNSSVEFILGDAEVLPFPDGSFDLVTGHSFLYLLDDAGRVLREIRRVLEPGGYVAFLEPRANPGIGWLLPSLRNGPRFFSTMIGWQIFSGLSGRFEADDIHKLLKSAGFENTDVTVTLNGLGWLVRARGFEDG